MKTNEIPEFLRIKFLFLSLSSSSIFNQVSPCLYLCPTVAPTDPRSISLMLNGLELSWIKKKKKKRFCYTLHKFL